MRACVFAWCACVRLLVSCSVGRVGLFLSSNTKQPTPAHLPLTKREIHTQTRCMQNTQMFVEICFADLNLNQSWRQKESTRGSRECSGVSTTSGFVLSPSSHPATRLVSVQPAPKRRHVISVQSDRLPEAFESVSMQW